jgi:hypothetical protein
MNFQLGIRDHGELQSAVARATLAGGASGLLQWRWPGAASLGLGLFAVGLAAVPPRTWRSAALAAGVAVLACAAATLAGVFGALGFAALGGLMFARDLDGSSRKTIAAAAGAIGLGTGAFVSGTIGASGALAAIPPGLGALALGAAAGFIASLGVTGRELEWRFTDGPRLLTPAGETSEPGSAAAPTIEASGELAGLLRRAADALGEARAALGDGAPEARAAAEDLLGRIERFGRRWRDLEQEAGRTDRLALAGRLEQVVAREQVAVDDVARGEYGRARAALRAQLDYLDGIERGRDRAVARLHHHIAALERLRLAALHHRSADASRIGEELAPLVDDLTAAGRELDIAAETLADLPALTA